MCACDSQVVRQFIQQSVLEKELLYFGYEAFGIAFVDPVREQRVSCSSLLSCAVLETKKQNKRLLFQDTWTPEDVMPKKLRDKQK